MAKAFYAVIVVKVYIPNNESGRGGPTPRPLGKHLSKHLLLQQMLSRRELTGYPDIYQSADHGMQTAAFTGRGYITGAIGMIADTPVSAATQRYSSRFRDLTWYRENVPCMEACPVHTGSGRYVQLVGNQSLECPKG